MKLCDNCKKDMSDIPDGDLWKAAPSFGVYPPEEYCSAVCAQAGTDKNFQDWLDNLKSNVNEARSRHGLPPHGS